MTEARRIQLHLGKCIEDLEIMHHIPDMKSKKLNLLCKSAQKLLESAEQYREKGDEELSYVFYMKYLHVVAFISTRQEFIREKKYYSDMIGVKNPNKAMDAAEKLKSSLIERYTEKEQMLKQLEEKKELELNKKSEESRMKAMESSHLNTEVNPAVTLPDLDEVTIKSEHLYSILKGNKLKVMLLDTRPAHDFTESHINHPACISVPQEVIHPGQSANVLEQKMPAASKAVWAERAGMSLIVMLDWSSQSLIPGEALYLLKTILLKWDVKVQYSRPPLALLGGYSEWVLRYPALTTNPRVSAPSTNKEDMDDLLGEIEYPSWTDISPPQSQSQSRPIAPRPKLGGPLIDRTSKPQMSFSSENEKEFVASTTAKAAALQVYSERSRSIQLILEEQQRMADTSLDLQMQRILAEEDWDKIYMRRENEKREDLRSEYKLREQEIISQLMQLENKQFDIEQENQSLREQLEEYQRKEKEDAAQLAVPQTPYSQREESDTVRVVSEAQSGVAARLARIAAAQAQRAQLERQREQLEGERVRKLAEARGKRKPQGDKEDDDGDTYMVSPGDGPGAMGRSQSSPNIAKMSSSEEEQPAPAFDRSTKPAPAPAHAPAHAPANAPARHRDFQPVWADVSRGLTGLKNLGNTCYMNSIIQCLNNTAILVNYFCTEQYLDHVNRTHGTRGQIAEELAAVVRALWSGQYRFIAIKDLRNEVGKHQRAFRGSEQQDSHEFLTILMDWLHDDLQFSIKPTGKDTLAPSEKAWHEYTKSRESLILRLFYGQIKSTVRCVLCGSQSVTYETFSNLSLELPSTANRCTLADCLKLYLNGETIPGWNCPQCKEKRDAVKKLDISRLPPVLVIHFKRFYLDPKEYMCNAYRKKQTYIDFPLEDFDMRQFSLHCPGNPLYNLYAVSNHYGSMEGGHYTAYCKSSVYDKWYKYDDHVVTEIPSSEVKSSAAYILFYTSHNATISR